MVLIYSELQFIPEDDARSEKAESRNDKFKLRFSFTDRLYIVIIYFNQITFYLFKQVFWTNCLE